MESESHLKNGIRVVQNWTPPGLLGERTDAPSLSNAPCRMIAPWPFSAFLCWNKWSILGKFPHREPWLSLNQSQWSFVFWKNCVTPTGCRGNACWVAEVYHVRKKPEGWNQSVMLHRWWTEIWWDQSVCIRRILGRKAGATVTFWWRLKVMSCFYSKML